MSANDSPASDTTPEARRAQIQMWRRMTPLEKLRAVAEMNQAAEQLALAGIRLRHPGASDRECFLRMAILKLGRELACKVYPEAALLDESGEK